MSTSIVRCVLLSFLILLVVFPRHPVSGQANAVTGDPVFTLSTGNAGWAPGGGAYTAAIPVALATGLTETTAIRLGGVITGGGNVYTNAQWMANDYQGKSWQLITTSVPPWSPRAFGSAIYVPLLSSPIVGVLLIVGGITASGATNEVAVDLLICNNTDA